MFSDHDETSPSIAAVSAPSAACSMFAVQQTVSNIDSQKTECDMQIFKQSRVSSISVSYSTNNSSHFGHVFHGNQLQR